MRYLILLLLSLLICKSNTIAQISNNPRQDSITYITVEPGEYLSLYASKVYRDASLWPKIYEYNKGNIKNPDLIYPGQRLRIPVEKINRKTTSAQEKLEESVDEINTNQNSKELLDKFRKAFNKAVNVEEGEGKSDESENKKSEPYKNITSGGIIVDQTISKMGSDFYHIFYSNWEKPDLNFSFTISINERPTPSLGTVISVKIDHTIVFLNRLEPRYHEIEKSAQQAISICQQYLNTHFLTRNPNYGIK